MLSNLNSLITKTSSRHSTAAKYFCCVVVYNSEQHRAAGKLLSKLWKSVCLNTSTIAGLNGYDCGQLCAEDFISSNIHVSKDIQISNPRYG